MILAILCYFLTYGIVVKCRRHEIEFKKFPLIRIVNGGFVFNSLETHRFRFCDKNIFKIRNILYIKTKNELILIKNIKNVQIFENYIYFTAMGKVEILCDVRSFYKYLVLDIKSEQFDMDNLRQTAILNYINNNFDYNFSNLLKKYIKIIKNILNIHIFKEKIVVKQNKYKIPFVLTYKINSKIKKVCVNETLEKF